MTRPSGILLAGGASRRFGRPKLLEPLGGAPLFHHPLGALLAVCDEVVIVLAPGAPDLPLPDDASRARFVHDDAAHEGPLAGTDAGLAKVRGEHAVVAGADMPGLSPGLLSLMVDRAARTRRDAVLLADVDGPRPLPAVLVVTVAAARAHDLLRAGERRLRALMDTLDADVLAQPAWSVADPSGAWRHDVDLPEDLPSGRR
jgi:molybdopterin-guanine dinucleotide biosynthesis protein A